MNGNPQTVKVNYTQYTIKTNFGCLTDYPYSGPAYFPTSVVLADGETYGLSYEGTAGYAPDITGRLAKITLPDGGYIQYQYQGTYNGIVCGGNGIVPTLLRTIGDNNGHTSTWKYVSAVNFNNGLYTTTTVTETDPVGNTTTYQFYGEYQTEKIVQDVNLGVLSTTVTCYGGNNSSQSGCISPTNLTWGAYFPNTQTDVYTTIGSSTSLVETKYDTAGPHGYSYGDVLAVKKYGFGATYPPSGTPASETDTTYANVNGITCGTVSSYIYDHPCVVTTLSSGTIVRQTEFTYSTAGHPTQTSTWVSGSTYLKSQATYNANGTIATATDVNGTTVSTYYYNGTGGCNNLFPTSVTVTGSGLPSGGLTNSSQWNCTGGVAAQTTDPNGHVTTYGYVNQSGTADPLWRLLSTTDPIGNVTWSVYSPGGTLPATEETILANSSTSSVDVLTTFDGLGRPYLKQTRQSPTSTNFDTVVTTYDALGRVSVVGMPCVAAASTTCSSSTTTTTYDGLNRPLQVTDGGGGTVSYKYVQNDVLQTVGPTPTFQKQSEYDGLGRLTSVCEITSASGSGSCGQSNAETGFLTNTHTMLSAISSPWPRTCNPMR